MSDQALGRRPDYLRDVPASRREWLAKKAAGFVALALGVASFVVVALLQEPMWTTPEWYLSVPGFAATVIATVISIARRERAHQLWLVGLGLAAAALVLGWFLLLAIILGATAVLMLILNTVM